MFMVEIIHSQGIWIMIMIQNTYEDKLSCKRTFYPTNNTYQQ